MEGRLPDITCVTMSKSQNNYLNLSPDELCIEFHLQLGYSPADLTDERCIDKPFTTDEVFDYLNKRRLVSN